MLKKLLLIIGLSIFSFGMDYHLNPVHISKSVWQFIGDNEIVTAKNGANIANTYWVKTKKHWVVIDSGASYMYAKQAYEKMKKIANLPIKFVVNTHMHDDHWMGNSYYKELNVPIYGTQQENDTFHPGDKSRVLNILHKKDLVGTKIVKIDHIVNKSFTLDVDGDKFEFIYLGFPAHTKQDYMII